MSSPSRHAWLHCSEATSSPACPRSDSHTADLLVIAAYLAATLVIGLWAHRL